MSIVCVSTQLLTVACSIVPLSSLCVIPSYQNSALDNSAVMRTYRPAKHRIIFLDYSGTIMPEEKQKDVMHFAVAAKLVEMPLPPPALKSLLTRLCQDPRNTVGLRIIRLRWSYTSDYTCSYPTATQHSAHTPLSRPEKHGTLKSDIYVYICLAIFLVDVDTSTVVSALTPVPRPEEYGNAQHI